MKTWIAKIKDSGPWIVFFEIFVIAQLLLIFVFNLTHLKYEAGFDSSAAMAQAMEIWNQKSIFLKHWDYQSTLGLDSVIIPASIFYGITHNIFFAYGIADCLGVLLYIYIFRDIFKMLQLPKLVRMIVYVLLLTPYSLEPLGYMPMMFTGAAYYIIKVLIPIMLIDILLKIKLEIPVRRYLHILITYFAAVYLTALSCGLYLLICGLFPIILYELFTVICSGSFKNFLSKTRFCFPQVLSFTDWAMPVQKFTVLTFLQMKWCLPQQKILSIILQNVLSALQSCSAHCQIRRLS